VTSGGEPGARPGNGDLDTQVVTLLAREASAPTMAWAGVGTKP
jgi:hypothetical protein